LIVLTKEISGVVGSGRLSIADDYYGAIAGNDN